MCGLVLPSRTHAGGPKSAESDPRDDLRLTEPALTPRSDEGTTRTYSASESTSALERRGNKTASLRLAQAGRGLLRHVNDLLIQDRCPRLTLRRPRLVLRVQRVQHCVAHQLPERICGHRAIPANELTVNMR